MSDNPLETNDALDQRIRDRAYHLWESEGRRSGHDVDYWERARELEAMMESAGSGQIANPIALGTDPTATPVEEASIQENLGEFPDRLSDQGEHPQTPSTKNLKS